MLLCAGARDLDRRKDIGLPASAFPLDLPSPGLMPIPDVSQPPQPMTGAAGMGPIAPFLCHISTQACTLSCEERLSQRIPGSAQGRFLARSQDGSEIWCGKSTQVAFYDGALICVSQGFNGQVG